MQLKKQKGFALISLIIAMVLMTALGAGIYSVTTSSSFSELLAGKDYSAYQLAKAGMRYAALNGGASIDGQYCMSGGQCFELTSTAVPGGKQYASRGYVNAGTFLASSRTLNSALAFASVTPVPPSPPTTPSPTILPNLGISGVGTGDFTYQDGTAGHSVDGTGQSALVATQLVSSGSAAEAYVSFTDAQVMLNPFKNDWCYAGQFLSYDTQVKVATGLLDSSGNFVMSQGTGNQEVFAPDRYAIGMALRYLTDTSANKHTMLGVSFMRSSDTIDDNIPNNMLPHVPTDRSDIPMVVLWERIDNQAGGDDVWLAYQRLNLSPASNVITNDLCADNSGNCLKKWSTIIARIVEAASIKLPANPTSVPAEGATILGTFCGSTGVTGQVIKIITDPADGRKVVLLNNVSSNFPSTGDCRPKDNYIWALYGDTGDHTGSTNPPIPTDQERSSNARKGTLFWPSQDIGSWVAANDHSTLVQWENTRNTCGSYSSPACIYRMGGLSEKELNAIIRYDSNTTSATYLTDTNNPELGLAAFGPLENKGFYDDFAFYTPSLGGRNRVSNVQATFDAAETVVTYTINTYASCPWTASFVHLTPSDATDNHWVRFGDARTETDSGTGSGNYKYTVLRNDTGATRSGTVSIAGLAFTVTQASSNGCIYAISPSSVSPGAGAVTGSTVAVTAGAGCTWTATSNDAWITITAGSSGTGNGAVTYSVSANPGQPRTGTMTIAEQTFTVNQASGCTYSISPSSVSPGAGAVTGSTVAVTAGAGCTWTATSNNAWITITAGSSGAGNGAVTYNIAANTGPARTGTMTIAGYTFTVNQASGCTYSINPVSASPSAAGGAASFNVTAGAGCPWTASTANTWLHTSSSGTGNDTVNYTVDANSCQARTGTITIAGLSFAVNQSAGTPLSITTASLPGGRLTVSYSSTVAASGGLTPYSWSASGLPPGLTITTSVGQISGTPTAAGLYNPTVTVTDSCSAPQTANGTFSIRIKPNPYSVLNNTGGTIYPDIGGCKTNNTIPGGGTYSIQYNDPAITFYQTRGGGNSCLGSSISISGSNADTVDVNFNGSVRINNTWSLVDN